MRALVTGGAGFIGSALCRKLAKDGHQVTILDDLSRGKKERLEGVKAEFVEGGLSDGRLVDTLVSKSDAVFHLAALSQVVPSIENPERTFASNVVGTRNVAEACSGHSKPLVFASSREVYGNPERLPCPEATQFSPQNPYAASKIAGEAWICAMQSVKPFPFAILRLANAYGPGDSGRVVPVFCEKAKRNEGIAVFGKGKLVDFVYVDDVVGAFLLAAEKMPGKPVNIGSGVGVGLVELAEKIIGKAKSSSRISVEGGRGGEVDRYVAGVSLAKKELGWSPKTDLDTGLELTLRV